jgi:peptidoglycan hydrolase CwlO-like protein
MPAKFWQHCSISTTGCQKATAADRAQSQLRDREAQLQQLTTEVEKAKGEREATQSKLDENQSQLDAMKAELSKANEATEQVKAKMPELENAANSAKEDEAERTRD